MKQVRLATQAAHTLSSNSASCRPAILRKDFILDRYQVLEARSHGADTLLLIVAILGVNQLKDLIQFSRKMGMEPLVEVHTEREMEIALDCGSKVIGVNNRNLHTFKLDLETTNRAVNVAERKGLGWRLKKNAESGVSSASSDILVAALSGITSSDDVQRFRDIGVSCVLVGETLMKASDPKATIASLLADPAIGTSRSGGSFVGNSQAINGMNSRKMVKTCGICRIQDAKVALQAGTSMLGVIFAPNSPRRASIEVARDIVDLTRSYGERSSSIDLSTQIASLSSQPSSTFDSKTQVWYSTLMDTLSISTIRKPLVVGVFQDQSIEEINNIIAETGIDIVQLHGNEPPEFIDKIKGAYCIKVLHVNAGEATHTSSSSSPSSTSSSSSSSSTSLLSQAQAFAGRAVALLVDSKVPGQAGGTGATFDWTVTEELRKQNIPIILAGGLTTSNVAAAIGMSVVSGVDVSSGVEEKAGVKNEKLLKDFLKASQF